MSEPTTERLALALESARAPAEMIRRARLGLYDDYKSVSATPLLDLYRDCMNAGLDSIARRVKNGDFDGTREEADAWFRSPEGAAVMRELTGQEPS